VSDGTLTLRRAQGRLLLRPSARTIRWLAFVVLAGVGAIAVWGGARRGDPSVAALPAATTLVCAWLCFLFEDLAAETTDATAIPLAARRAVRVAIAVPAATVAWFALTWIGPLTGPTAIMAVAFAAESLLALAAAAVAARVEGPAHGGFTAAGVLTFVAIVLPAWLGRPPSLDPVRPPLGTPFTYWSVVAAIAAVALVGAHLVRRR
jgi:hypothetical protein